MKKIFVFHEVYNLKNFEKTIDYISKFYEFKDLGEFLDSNNKNICHITFDDGHYTFENAFKILKNRHIPVSLFISFNKIFKHENYWFQNIEFLQTKIKNFYDNDFKNYFALNKEIKKYSLFDLIKSYRIEDIDKFIKKSVIKYKLDIPYFNLEFSKFEKLSKESLIEFGAHTVNHPILLNETLNQTQFEIKKSIYDLNEYLNKKVTTFAYPNGIRDLDFNNREKHILRENRIKYAFSMHSDNFQNNLSDNLELPRISLSHNLIKNYILFKMPNLYSEISKINLPFLKKSENVKRFKLKNSLY